MPRRPYRYASLSLPLALALDLLLVVAPLSAQTWGFADQGFVNATVRTVYDSPNEGTSLNPLTIVNPCLFPASQSITNCPAGPAVYAQSNWWRQNWNSSCGAYVPCSWWTLYMNNEGAFNNCNSGPPNASLPRAEPGNGVMGFTAIPGSLVGETFFRAHLVLNLFFPNPCSPGAIPFLAIGADRDRGNLGRTPGFLNKTAKRAPSKVRFTARLWDLALPDCYPGQCGAPLTNKGSVDFSLWAVAEWGGVPRMLFIDLLHPNRDYPGGTAGAVLDWNWPIMEDALYPGADLAFFEAEDIAGLCGGYSVPAMSGQIGQEIQYTIDLQWLFQCASDHGLFRDPLPSTTDLPIKTVAWKNEGFGHSGAIWTSVHGMEMIP